MTVVDLAGLGLEVGKMLEAAGDVEVIGSLITVLMRRFDAKGSPFLQVLPDPGVQILLDPKVLVAEVHADLGPGAEDPLAVDVLGRTTQRSREDHCDLAGAADPDVVLEEGLEERSGPTRVVEDERGGGRPGAWTAPPRADSSVGDGEGRGDDGHPLLVEGLDVARPEPVGDVLKATWLVTCSEAVREHGAQSGTIGLALDPIAAVHPHFRRTGEVAGDLDDAGTQVAVEHVKAADGALTPGLHEGEAALARLRVALLAAPDSRQPLGGDDRDDATATSASGAVQVRLTGHQPCLDLLGLAGAHIQRLPATLEPAPVA